MKTRKTQPSWLQIWERPAVIDGATMKNEELVEFLDWQLATGQKDVKLFRHLKATGYLDKNPVTSKMLSEAVDKLAARK